MSDFLAPVVAARDAMIDGAHHSDSKILHLPAESKRESIVFPVYG